MKVSMSLIVMVLQIILAVIAIICLALELGALWGWLVILGVSIIGAPISWKNYKNGK